MKIRPRHPRLWICSEYRCKKKYEIFCLRESFQPLKGYQVCITQPRRVAAVTLAVRVADEVGCMIGSTIGYAVRFDSKQDEEKTRVKFVTDGVLLQEMTSDPLLRKYSVIMIDEAHERSMQTDMCLGLLKKIQKVRSDLRIIVASATLDAQFFKDFFEQNVTSDSSKDSVKIRLFLQLILYEKCTIYPEKQNLNRF